MHKCVGQCFRFVFISAPHDRCAYDAGWSTMAFEVIFFSHFFFLLLLNELGRTVEHIEQPATQPAQWLCTSLHCALCVCVIAVWMGADNVQQHSAAGSQRKQKLDKVFKVNGVKFLFYFIHILFVRTLFVARPAPPSNSLSLTSLSMFNVQFVVAFSLCAFSTKWHSMCHSNRSIRWRLWSG